MGGILDELRRIYDDLDRELAAEARSCRACGSCCDFRRSGLALFAEPLEVAAYLRARARGAPSAPGSERCPAWDGVLCGERTWRPIGCRTHFCDRAAAPRGREAHERALARLRRACAEAGYPLGYRPFLAALAAPEAGQWLDRLGGGAENPGFARRESFKGFILQLPREPGKEPVNLERLKELIALMERHALVELEIEEEGGRVRLRKGGDPVIEKQVVAIPATVPAAEPAPPGGARGRTPEPERAGLIEIRSPMVGTFYRTPSPEADPYVQVGDRIEEGTVLCIIEAMKVMNEVKSEVSGVIREIPVENGEAVEYGQVIFVVEPA